MKPHHYLKQIIRPANNDKPLDETYLVAHELVKEWVFLNNSTENLEDFIEYPFDRVLFFIDLMRNAHKLKLQEKAIQDNCLAAATISYFNYDKKNKDKYEIYNLFPYAFDKEDIVEIEQEKQRQKIMQYMMKGGK